MPSSRVGGSPFSVLGFTSAQEDLYRVLLRNSGSTVEALAGLLDVPVADLHDRINRFVAAGLVELSGPAGGRRGARTVRVHPPEQAVSRLVNEEARRLRSVEDQLQAVRGLLPLLNAEHLSSTSPRGEPVSIERVEGDVVELVRSLSATSAGDLLWLRPDQWKLPPGNVIDLWVQEIAQGGRRSRAIYPARVLEEAPDVLRERAAAGEHVRILAEVPFRLAIMGSSAALIPEEPAVNSERRLVIRQTALVNALTLLFEGLWDRAMAVPGLDAQLDEDGGGGRRLLLDLMAGGAKDEQIARALGLSLRTVRRRVAEVLDELGAESRFHAGVEAVRRGWL